MVWVDALARVPDFRQVWGPSLGGSLTPGGRSGLGFLKPRARSLGQMRGFSVHTPSKLHHALYLL